MATCINTLVSPGRTALGQSSFHVRLLCSGKMDRAEGREPHNVRCGSCGQMAPAYDIVNYTSADKLPPDICSHCFNAEVAKLGGLDKFEHIRFEPVRLVDCAGKSHKFHFRTHLFGPG